MRKILSVLVVAGVVTGVYARMPDTVAVRKHYPLVHRIGIDFRPGYIAQTNSFVKGYRYVGRNREAMEKSMSYHLKYAFAFHPESYEGRMFPGSYQGIGLSYNDFGNYAEVGIPKAVYVFQGAPIVRFSPHFSLNYEWNFGAALGWHPYDWKTNPNNQMIGSKVNAYLNLNFAAEWKLCPYASLTAGVEATHYSNGNTSYPNAGMNILGGRVGVVCTLNPPKEEQVVRAYTRPDFRRHFSYDMVLFGSWRRKGIITQTDGYISPDKYPVVGFNFAPMYNFGPRFRAGLSLDGVYDSSSNVYMVEGQNEDGVYEKQFVRPPMRYQLSLGFSGRAEFVMPFFAVNVGIGVNALTRDPDQRGLYQTLALKLNVTHDAFLHVGYTLQKFHDPSYLMLGVGYRFGNKRAVQ